MKFSYQNLKLSHDRDDIILKYCHGKKVLHIGAADSPYTKEKYENGTLLHKRLSSVTSNLIGIDKDSEASEWLNEHGLSKIHVMDINEVATLDFSPEVIIYGETIEHITNVGVSLDNFKKIMSPSTMLIISTPNLFHLWFASMVIRNYEEVHHDHKIGFTYGLLNQCLQAAGLIMKDFYFTFLPRETHPWWRVVWHWVAAWRHGFAETLLAVCQTEQDSNNESHT